MDGMTLTLWLMTGTFIGGVVTPLVVWNREFNDWLSMVIGVVVGAVGNVILLVPLWLGLHFLLPKSADKRPLWQRDTANLADLQTSTGAASFSPTGMLARNFWPNARQDGHSHRASYLGVFVALVMITAIEVLITVIDMGFPVAGPLVALSTAKVLLVAMFFMHLRYDSRWYSGIFVYALPFAVLIVIVLALA